MAADEWKVPRPSGVISSRDLARNTSNLLTELSEEETDDDEALEVLGLLDGFDLNHCHRILETLSDGDEWVPDAVAAAVGVDGLMVLLGFLEIRKLIVRRFGYYRISKEGMEVLQAMRILDAEDREGVGN
jgi:hypothetical protein